jgi:hypothetical protein
MPALNVRFTEAELETLRRRAEAEGVPVTRLAHDVLIQDTARASHDALVMGAAAHVIGLSQDLLKRLADR